MAAGEAGVQKIKHILNSIKTIMKALVVRCEKSFVWWRCRAVQYVWQRQGGRSLFSLFSDKVCIQMSQG